MKLEVTDNGTIQLREVYNAINFLTPDGEHLCLQMRDGGYEIWYNGDWFSFKQGNLSRLGEDLGNGLDESESIGLLLGTKLK